MLGRATTRLNYWATFQETIESLQKTLRDVKLHLITHWTQRDVAQTHLFCSQKHFHEKHINVAPDSSKEKSWKALCNSAAQRNLLTAAGFPTKRMVALQLWGKMLHFLFEGIKWADCIQQSLLAALNLSSFMLAGLTIIKLLSGPPYKDVAYVSRWMMEARADMQPGGSVHAQHLRGSKIQQGKKPCSFALCVSYGH